MPFEIRSIGEADLPAVATYLAQRGWGSDSDGQAGGQQVEALLVTLRWRLVENPASHPDVELGQYVANDAGQIVGTHLAIPAHFLEGDRVLNARCSSALFVDDEARMAGFWMFRRSLSLPGVDLHFATTCNAQSGALWARLGGAPLADSACEHLWVRRFGPVAEELGLRRGWPKPLPHLLGLLGHVAAPWLVREPPPSSIRLYRSEDWDMLAALSAKLRSKSRIIAEHSAAYLRWRYARTPSSDDMRVFGFTDAMGRNGWISLRRSRRGMRAQVRAWTILDVVRPRGEFDTRGLVTAVLREVEPDVDMLVIRGVPGASELSSLPLRGRYHWGPLSYVIARGSTSSTDMAERLQLTQADGDSAG